MKKIKRYYKKVEQLLPLEQFEKKKYMDTFKSNLEDFLYEYPDSNIDVIMEQFGTPESIASSFLAGEDDSYISQKITATKFKKKIIIAFIIVLFTIVALSLTYVIVDTYRINHGYYDELIK